MKPEDSKAFEQLKLYALHRAHCCHHAGGVCSCGRYDVLKHIEFALEADPEGQRLLKLINTPSTEGFFESVQLEAAHQTERWGIGHDDSKDPHDWFWLLGFLAGKAVSIPEKRTHHIISSAACLLNWYRHESGDTRAFNPGWRP